MANGAAVEQRTMALLHPALACVVTLTTTLLVADPHELVTV